MPVVVLHTPIHGDQTRENRQVTRRQPRSTGERTAPSVVTPDPSSSVFNAARAVKAAFSWVQSVLECPGPQRPSDARPGGRGEQEPKELP